MVQCPLKTKKSLLGDPRIAWLAASLERQLLQVSAHMRSIKLEQVPQALRSGSGLLDYLALVGILLLRSWMI
jgi:hypothetical protein